MANRPTEAEVRELLAYAMAAVGKGYKWDAFDPKQVVAVCGELLRMREHSLPDGFPSLLCQCEQKHEWHLIIPGWTFGPRESKCGECGGAPVSMTWGGFVPLAKLAAAYGNQEQPHA